MNEKAEKTWLAAVDTSRTAILLKFAHEEDGETLIQVERCRMTGAKIKLTSAWHP
jgi:hypothetical protein